MRQSINEVISELVNAGYPREQAIQMAYGKQQDNGMAQGGLVKMDNEESAPEWDRIKNWVMAKDTKYSHPVEDMVRRETMKDPEHMAQGGVAGRDEELMKFLQPQGSGMIAPSAVGLPETPELPIPQPPVTPPIPDPQTQALAPEVPMPPQDPTDASFDDEASKILGNSPESRQAIFERTQEPRAVNAISLLGSGLGDAIARSYGRDSGANHMKNTMGVLDAKNKALLDNAKEGAEFGKQRYGLSQQLQAKDPTSPFSKLNQKAYGPALISAGIPEDKVKFMSAGVISDILGKRIDLSKALAEADMAAASLGLNRIKTSSEIQHQRAQEEEARAQTELEATKALGARGPLDKVYGLIPGTTSNKVNKALEQKMNSSQQNVVTATNPKTGRKVKSYDGGKTWQ